MEDELTDLRGRPTALAVTIDPDLEHELAEVERAEAEQLPIPVLTFGLGNTCLLYTSRCV